MTKHSVCCTLHLRNYTLHDCHLWCKCVKWWYLQVFFSILKFWFSVLSGCWKGKKWPKMTKNFVCYTLYFRNHISDKKIISPGIFFILFSKFRSSGSLGVWGVVKEQKIAKNSPKWQKILSVSLCISGTIHHMIVSFGTHVYNDHISSKFFYFSNLILGFLGGLKGQKMTWNYQYQYVLLYISGTVDHIIKSLMIYRCFSLFFLKKCKM